MALANIPLMGVKIQTYSHQFYTKKKCLATSQPTTQKKTMCSTTYKNEISQVKEDIKPVVCVCEECYTAVLSLYFESVMH